MIKLSNKCDFSLISRNSINFLQAKELLEINQDTQSASSTSNQNFYRYITRRRGGTCTVIGTVNLRFTRGRMPFPRCLFQLRLLRLWEASNASGLWDFAKCGNEHVFFRTVEFIGAPKSSVELWNICAGLTIVHTSCQNDRSFFFFSILFI